MKNRQNWGTFLPDFRDEFYKKCLKSTARFLVNDNHGLHNHLNKTSYFLENVVRGVDPLKCLYVLFLSPLKNVQLFTKKDQALRLFGLPSANGCLLVVATSTHFKDEKMTKNRLWESQK